MITSPEHHMKDISRSFSSFDINERTDVKQDQQTQESRNERPDSNASSVGSTSLPPLMKNSISCNGLDARNKSGGGENDYHDYYLKETPDTKTPPHTYVTVDGVGIDAVYKEMNGVNEEWVVPRPQIKKPRDLLKPEGDMDLITTFKDTYETTAQKLLSQRIKEEIRRRELRELKEFEARYGEAGKKRGRRYRPKTSLKSGGRGYYETEHDAYKRFIVVDPNNNHHPHIQQRQQLQQNPLNINEYSSHKGIVVDGQHAKRGTAAVDRLEYLPEDDQRKIVLPKVHTETNHSKGEHHISKAEPEYMNGHHELRRTPVRDSGRRSSRNLSRARRQAMDVAIEKYSHEARRGETHEISGESRDIMIQSDKRRDDMMRPQLVETETQTPTPFDSGQNNEQNYENSKVGHEGISESQYDSRYPEPMGSWFRHPSLPRFKHHKHKNDSQLRFDGNMDFTTTCRSYHQDFTPVVRKTTNVNGYPSHVTFEKFESMDDLREDRSIMRKKKFQNRNLFRSSNDLCLCSLKKDGRKDSHLECQTTYSTQFPGHQYCPALDLGSSKSEYKFRKETGGHKFYYSPTRFY